MKILRFKNYPPLGLNGLVLLLAFYYTAFGNWPLYRLIEQTITNGTEVSTAFLVTIPLFFFAAFTLIFSLLTWPYLARPFFTLILLTSSGVSYAMLHYNTVFDENMIENIVSTNSAEATSYLSLASVTWILLTGILPVLLLWTYPLRQSLTDKRFYLRRAGLILSCLAVIGGIATFQYKDYSSYARNHRHIRKMIVPVYYVYSGYKYLRDTYGHSSEPFKQLALDAVRHNDPTAMTGTTAKKPTLFVMVLGETARAQNYELNGYDRPTNAYTKDLGVLSFHNVQSCGTATAVSVPCVFSAMTRDTFDSRQADNQDNLTDILARVGVDVLWKENDGGDKNVAARVRKIQVDPNQNAPYCDGRTCQDMALLTDLESNINQMRGDRMVVLHIMGSHGPTYYKRYPEAQRRFTPDCQRSDIENCSTEEIVNTYDNTILYTDYVLAQLIKKLQGLSDRYQTAMLYFSDHGESLGEGGMYLHGFPYALAPAYQTHVPMLFWSSTAFQQRKHLNMACLGKAAADNSLSHDNIFHSVLGIFNVKTELYEPDLDLFAPCRDTKTTAAMLG